MLLAKKVAARANNAAAAVGKLLLLLLMLLASARSRILCSQLSRAKSIDMTPPTSFSLSSSFFSISLYFYQLRSPAEENELRASKSTKAKLLAGREKQLTLEAAGEWKQ